MVSLKKIFTWGGSILGVSVALVSAIGLAASAQTQEGAFSLQVSPSPLVTTIKPGQVSNLELKIRNSSTGTEKLKIEPREFTINKKSGEVKLGDKPPLGISEWISFSKPVFTIESNQSVTQKIHIALPKDTGFSYSFALVISRANGEPKAKSGTTLSGSLAVFTLINVDRPGAERKFDVTEFKTASPVFEYLPAEFSIAFRNTGNTIIQPAGNVFIQRGSDDAEPISTLPVNNAGGYLLPGSPRVLKTSWSEGFPVYKTTEGQDGEETRELAWDWSKLMDFRFGMYTAKLVAIYNDGHHDVPVQREVTFWVIPWRAMLAFIAFIAVAAFVIHRLIHRRTQHAVKRAIAEHEESKKSRKKKKAKKDEE